MLCKNEYRIAVVGTHSTGKTTLARLLAEAIGIPYMRGDFAKEIAHRLAPKKSMEELTPKEHWKIQKEILNNHKKLLEKEHIFVSDATIFTWKAYTEQFVGKDNLSKISEYHQYERILNELKEKYTHIFYLPPEIPLELDGFRPRSQALRLALDRAILKELSSVSYIILAGSLDKRLQIAQNALKIESKKGMAHDFS